MSYAVYVWVGNWGSYEIPSELRSVKINRHGYPDLRYKSAQKLIDWVKDKETEARRKIWENYE